MFHGVHGTKIMNVGVVERKTGWAQAEKQGTKERGERWGSVSRGCAVRCEADEETEESP